MPARGLSAGRGRGQSPQGSEWRFISWVQKPGLTALPQSRHLQAGGWQPPPRPARPGNVHPGAAGQGAEEACSGLWGGSTQAAGRRGPTSSASLGSGAPPLPPPPGARAPAPPACPHPLLGTCQGASGMGAPALRLVGTREVEKQVAADRAAVHPRREGARRTVVQGEPRTCRKAQETGSPSRDCRGRASSGTRGEGSPRDGGPAGLPDTTVILKSSPCARPARGQPCPEP